MSPGIPRREIPDVQLFPTICGGRRMKAPERRSRCTVRCGHPPVQRGPRRRLRTHPLTLPTWAPDLLVGCSTPRLTSSTQSTAVTTVTAAADIRSGFVVASLSLLKQQHDAAAAAAAQCRHYRWQALSPTPGPVGPRVSRYGGRLVVFRVPRWMRSSHPPAWQPPVAAQDPPSPASTTCRGWPFPPPPPASSAPCSVAFPVAGHPSRRHETRN